MNLFELEKRGYQGVQSCLHDSVFCGGFAYKKLTSSYYTDDAVSVVYVSKYNANNEAVFSEVITTLRDFNAFLSSPSIDLVGFMNYVGVSCLHDILAGYPRILDAAICYFHHGTIFGVPTNQFIIKGNSNE